MQTDQLGFGHQPEEEKESESGDDDSGHDEGQGPIVLDPNPGQNGAEDVPDGRVRVPNAENGPLFAFAEPIGHDGDDGGPPGGLGESGHDLHDDKVGDVVDVPGVGQPEEHGEDPGEDHAEAEEVPEADIDIIVECQILNLIYSKFL